MLVQPYLFRDGKCEEALAFYRKALGAEVEMMLRFKESPDPSMVPPEGGDKIMHACFRIGDTRVMASDGRCLSQPTFQGFALSLTVSDAAQAHRFFAAPPHAGQ